MSAIIRKDALVALFNLVTVADPLDGASFNEGCRVTRTGAGVYVCTLDAAEERDRVIVHATLYDGTSGTPDQAAIQVVKTAGASLTVITINTFTTTLAEAAPNTFIQTATDLAFCLSVYRISAYLPGQT